LGKYWLEPAFFKEVLPVASYGSLTAEYSGAKTRLFEAGIVWFFEAVGLAK